MNPFERFLGQNNEATLRYGHNEFKIVLPGDYVRCAVSGARIALDDLKYWSVELQEPYATAEASFQRYLEHRGIAPGPAPRDNAAE